MSRVIKYKLGDVLLSLKEGFKEISAHKNGRKRLKSLKESEKLWESGIRVLMIREDKVDAFLNQKRDDSMWKKIQQKAEVFRKNMKNNGC